MSCATLGMSTLPAGCCCAQKVTLPLCCVLQAEAAAEAKLKGPHPFPLERLLATFWELRNAQDKEPASADEQRDAQSGDLFMQISSLVSQRFLSQVSAAPCLLRMSLHSSQGLGSYSANLARSTS